MLQYYKYNRKQIIYSTLDFAMPITLCYFTFVTLSQVRRHKEIVWYSTISDREKDGRAEITMTPFTECLIDQEF